MVRKPIVPPNSSEFDKAHMVARAAIGSIPAVGQIAKEVFNEHNPPPKARATAAWQEAVSFAINELVDGRMVLGYVSWQPAGTVGILGAKNVSSITDNGTRDFSINFSLPFDPNSLVIHKVGDCPDFEVIEATSSSARLLLSTETGTFKVRIDGLALD